MPEQPPPVAIVILTWNAVSYTQRCLETLKSLTSHPNYRVIVVDNGSTDGSVDYLKSLDWVHLITNDENLGFTRGCNIGMQETRPDEDVVLMNNDIIVNDPAWLDKLQQVAYSEASVGVVGTRLTDPEGRINHLGSFMPPITLYGEQMGGLEKDIGQATLDHPVECTVFAVAYLKRDCINTIGLLDEDLFAYFEDTEYCFRATKAGFTVMYAGSVSPLHHHNTSTRENKVDFWKMYLKSREVFKKKWGTWLEEERYDTEAVWHSVMHQPLGYARSSHKMMLSVHFEGVRLAYRNAYGESDEEPQNKILADVMKRKVSKDVTQIGYCMAEAFPKIQGRRKVGWTMLEVTGLPKSWADGCNTMDEIWVPASFNIETFKNSGVRVPIRVMPLGVDTDYYNPHIKGAKPDDRFVFLSVFEWGERKAPEVLLRAYANEFKESDDVVLMLSVFNRDPLVNVQAEIAAMNLPTGAPIAVMINPEFADYQMGSLYRSSDCFVLPSRGEGWGMPILEAMACGVPTITTDWSGPADFISDDIAYPLQYSMTPAIARCPYYEGFEWAEPNEEHLRHLMRHVYENAEEAQAKGAAAAVEVAANHTWQKAAAKVKSRLLEMS